MEKYYITFRSVTYGQKGERALKKEGMDCILCRAPRWMEQKGCGYALVVREPQKAVEILKHSHAAYERVFAVQGNQGRELKGL